MMPKVNGIELLRIIRDRKNLTPVLLLTAKDTDEDIVTGLDAGATDYLTKSFSFEVLCARIRAMLRVKEKLEENIRNYDYEGSSYVIKVYIHHLRKKIDDNYEKKLLHTIKNVGYVVKEE